MNNLMKIKVKKRYGPARICEFEFKNNKLITPNILFINTPRFKDLDNADITISNKNTNQAIINLEKINFSS